MATIARWMAGSFLMPRVTKGAAVCWVFVVWVMLLCVCVYVGDRYWSCVCLSFRCQPSHPKPIKIEGILCPKGSPKGCLRKRRGCLRKRETQHGHCASRISLEMSFLTQKPSQKGCLRNGEAAWPGELTNRSIVCPKGSPKGCLRKRETAWPGRFQETVFGAACA